MCCLSAPIQLDSTTAASVAGRRSRREPHRRHGHRPGRAPRRCAGEPEADRRCRPIRIPAGRRHGSGSQPCSRVKGLADLAVCGGEVDYLRRGTWSDQPVGRAVGSGRRCAVRCPTAGSAGSEPQRFEDSLQRVHVERGRRRAPARIATGEGRQPTVERPGYGCRMGAILSESDRNGPEPAAMTNPHHACSEAVFGDVTGPGETVGNVRAKTHNPEVAGSNPAPATTGTPASAGFLLFRIGDGRRMVAALPAVPCECAPARRR
jgi:hypothetical protein